MLPRSLGGTVSAHDVIDEPFSDPLSEGPVSRVERQLAAAQAITHIGSWEWNVRTSVLRWSDELYRIYGLAPRSCEMTFDSFLDRLHPEDRERTMTAVTSALERRTRFAHPERIVRPDGSIRHLETVGEPALDSAGQLIGLIGTCRDVTDEWLALRMAAAEQRIFERVAEGAPLTTILRDLAIAIEEQSPPTIVSIHLLDPDGGRVRHGAAPSLPEAYSRAIDGALIGPNAGSCGTAAFLKRPVLVSDIETDTRWDDYRELARASGLRACWSTPILATDNRALGTFALYYREPRAPTERDLSLIARATHIAGIAIQRRELEEELRALSAHVESAREEERTGIAREIHDELGQALTALKMDLAWIGRRAAGTSGLSREALLEKVQAMSSMTDQIIDQVRRISSELRPGVLDDLGLLPALEWQGQEFERRTGLTCVIHSNLTDETTLDRSLATTIFRVFQESLTNVARHSEATHVEVRLERVAGWLELEVADDGKGIAPEVVSSPTSLGLLGIRERARRLGGMAAVGAAPSKGTVVSVRVPLDGGAE